MATPFQYTSRLLPLQLFIAFRTSRICTVLHTQEDQWLSFHSSGMIRVLASSTVLLTEADGSSASSTALRILWKTLIPLHSVRKSSPFVPVLSEENAVRTASYYSSRCFPISYSHLCLRLPRCLFQLSTAESSMYFSSHLYGPYAPPHQENSVIS
jgi:hypothetical protein